MPNPASRQEPFRPQFHFSAQRNWINDPNGLVWFDGEYHLFFQYNPQGSLWGHMSWGHAVSPDLVNWTELPVAIEEDERAMIFSGSVVIDRDNTSGLAVDGQAVMVACYTACLQAPAVGQMQDLAFSTDRGRTWTKFPGNPVLDIGLKDFRDPKVFWHRDTAQWVMVVVVPDDREARFYGSPNLREWTELSRFSAPFVGQGIWECPDLMELPTDEGGSVWMFKVDAFGGHPSGETGARIFFGSFDGRRFQPEAEDAPRWADLGSDFYAALSWANLPAQPWDGHPVWLAWMNCHRYAAHVPTEPWRGAMSMPRRLSARRLDGRWHLVQDMVPAVADLRGTPVHHPGGELAAGSAIRLWEQTGPGVCLELQSTVLATGAKGHAALRLVVEGAQGEPPQVVEVGYDAHAGAVYVDRSRSGFIPADDARYVARRWAPCRRPCAGNPLSLRIWWDWSSVEVLADDGMVSLTEQVLPSGGTARLEAAAIDEQVVFGPMTVWPLRAAQLR